MKQLSIQTGYGPDSSTLVSFPSGETMLASAHYWTPRNRSHATANGAVREQALVMQRKTDMCNVWFVWMDGALHGQFPCEREALKAARE